MSCVERQKTQFLVLSGDFYSISKAQEVAHYKTKTYSYPGKRKRTLWFSNKVLF